MRGKKGSTTASAPKARGVTKRKTSANEPKQTALKLAPKRRATLTSAGSDEKGGKKERPLSPEPSDSSQHSVDLVDPETTPKKELKKATLPTPAASSKKTAQTVRESTSPAPEVTTKTAVTTISREEAIEKLRGFDLMMQFGPCVGITRAARWRRAKKLGMSPPEDIMAILTRFGEDPAASDKDTLIFEGLWYDVPGLH